MPTKHERGWTPRVEKVILATDARGKGTEVDPCRRVTQVFTLDGELIAEHDPFKQPNIWQDKP